MAKLIGSITSDNFGENLFLTKALEYLDESTIIYWNRQVFGREFDICILMPGKGILVVELKGWREENILRVENGDTIIINTDDGEVPASPQRQARGYRFSLERHIKQSIGKFPLVFQMVCLPQVSKSFYRSQRLNVPLEESFTILKEDLFSLNSFTRKINLALGCTATWHRHPFDERTMLEVRNLFETDIELENQDDTALAKVSTTYHDFPYSVLYCSISNDSNFDNELSVLTNDYIHGTKLYCIFSNGEQLTKAVKKIDDALKEQGLCRTRKGDLEIDLEETAKHEPEFTGKEKAFSGFNFSFSILSKPDIISSSLKITDGQVTEEQIDLLRNISANSGFNAEQYLVEHADPDKNIVIRAGAGTGKTYTMISRIGYVCYAQKTALQNMTDRIVMITFTNEAANQMEDKLKTYFKNCYLISGRAEYLAMVANVDAMQISTIHSYAKKLISKLGTEFGYGVDLSITSSEFYRKRKISDLIDKYIKDKELYYGKDYTASLGMPVYALIDNILDFIEKLHNKSIDLESIGPEAFGNVGDEENQKRLHELLAYIIPAVEKEYSEELLENNSIHLGSMMSVLNKFVMDSKSEGRIKELSEGYRQYMFIDEFQDTDDTQIDIILKLSCLLNYRLFLVGDIKQCIYRFRGAEEKAFDRLHISDNPDAWLEYQLQLNYRTDRYLLDIFDKSFSKWGSDDNELLAYTPKDRLIGMKEYNGYIYPRNNKFYSKITIDEEDERISALVHEIERIQKRIQYEKDHGILTNPKERSIAILVRENWQAEMIRTLCSRAPYNLTIQTNTGGDLYISQPALDMLILVNSLIHFDEADYLFNLATSNFFKLNIPKSNLYNERQKMREDWKSKRDERKQVNDIINALNTDLVNSVAEEKTWPAVIHALRVKPVLQVMRELYNTLRPWENYSTDQWKQHYYQLNVDLLFEQLIDACNTDNLTVNTLGERLYNNIVTQVSVDSRSPENDEKTEIPIQCITVHKSKGLEYGHIIMPYCSFAIDRIKNAKLHVSTEKENNQIRIGYRFKYDEDSDPVQNNFYNEHIEKEERSREETRILYVAMTRAIQSFSWIEMNGKTSLCWQQMIESEN